MNAEREKQTDAMLNWLLQELESERKEYAISIITKVTTNLQESQSVKKYLETELAKLKIFSGMIIDVKEIKD